MSKKKPLFGIFGSRIDIWDIVLFTVLIASITSFIWTGGTNKELIRTLAESSIDAVIIGLLIYRIMKKSER